MPVACVALRCLLDTLPIVAVPHLCCSCCAVQVIALEYRGAGLSTDYSDQPLTYCTMAGGFVLHAIAFCCTAGKNVP